MQRFHLLILYLIIPSLTGLQILFGAFGSVLSIPVSAPDATSGAAIRTTRGRTATAETPSHTADTPSPRAAADPAVGTATPALSDAAADSGSVDIPVCTGTMTATPPPFRLDPADYIYPVEQVQGRYSANFGEMRPNHFHSGIDIKTDGVEGKPLVAVADGYVSRIVVRPGGYGRALYLTLHNGVTAVYGHIARFRDDIEAYVQAERLRRQRNQVDLTCPPQMFPVAQGDLIARSGNSGSSFGPHLHFELRETATQRVLNPVRQGVIRPVDNLPPRIVRIHYIETDTVRGVPIHRAPASYDAVRIDARTYRLARHEPVPVGRNGHFVVEATDRRPEVSNTFGLYRAALHVDSVLRFEYRMDGFTFDRTRDCNAAAYYPLQLTTRNEAIRLAALEGACTEFCPVRVDQGAVGATEGQRRQVMIETEDDCGNCARIAFDIAGRAPWHAADDSLATACDRRRTTTLAADGLQLTIPAGALYESQLLRIGRSHTPVPQDTTLVILTPPYRVLACTTPLRRPVEVAVETYVPPVLRTRTALALIDHRKRIVYAGGRYTAGRVGGRLSATGDLLVVADTVPPRVRPLFSDGGDLTAARRLTFRIGDNFSGIASCELWIDGAWAICDRYPIQGTAVHLFTDSPSGSRHTVRLVVRDACGNETIWKGTFFR